MCDMNKKNEIFNNTQELSGKMKKNEEQGQAAEDQKKDDLKYDFWLASLLYINSSKRIQVRELAGSARAVYELREETLQNMYLFTETELQYLLESRKGNLNRAWERFLAKNMQLIPYGSRAYPDKLKQIAQPPYGIFCKGAMPDARKSVGIVGARMCSEYGRSIATKLGKLLAGKDVQVISGMALGVDSASHAGALQGKGSTFAVLGCGCDICYPKNARNLYENIQSSGGGILSEYPPGTEPMPYRFPERNRIISALSDCLVVVEAKKKSGSLITADAALEQGKDVYAVPGRFGDALSEGCNALIGQGAGIIYDLDIFLENLGYLPEKEAETTKIKNISLAKTEQLVYALCDLHPKHINYIIEETGLDLLTVLHDLGNLKRYGLVQETFQNYFSKRI
ncbi:MAG: DNA-processing protein DprA [Lachnospiraceae bacterium]|nr:DNA-processing protein DprA [Lachnospiraceae bacterium]